MEDNMEIFERYKCIKEIADLIDGITKLREYYYSKQYDKMHQHINNLTYKYFHETIQWNSVNKAMPVNEDQSYYNAEQFLRAKGIDILLKSGISLQ